MKRQLLVTKVGRGVMLLLLLVCAIEAEASRDTTSGSVLLTVGPTTAITTQPMAQVICQSSTLSLSVVAEGSAPLSYQWQKDDANIADAMDSIYLKPGMLLADGGEYRCVVTGGCGADTSEAVVVTVFVPVDGLGGGCTDSDGNKYRTVSIGCQEWMAENLRVMHQYGESWDDEVDARFYNWAAAMNGSVASAANPSGVQGLCPEGWHLPSDAEWTQLEVYLTAAYPATTPGMVLKSTTGWSKSMGVDGNGTDDLNFHGFPCGEYFSGKIYSQGVGGYYWTSMQAGGSGYNALYAYLTCANGKLNHAGVDKTSGFNIRCVKD